MPDNRGPDNGGVYCSDIIMFGEWYVWGGVYLEGTWAGVEWGLV